MKDEKEDKERKMKLKKEEKKRKMKDEKEENDVMKCLFPVPCKKQLP